MKFLFYMILNDYRNYQNYQENNLQFLLVPIQT